MSTENSTPATEQKKSGLGKYLAVAALGVAGLGAAYSLNTIYQSSQTREVAVTMTDSENAALMKGDKCVISSLHTTFDEAAVSYMEAEGRKSVRAPLVLKGHDCDTKAENPVAGARPHNVTVTIPPGTYEEYTGTFEQAFGKNELSELFSVGFLYYGLNDAFKKALAEAQKPQTVQPADKMKKGFTPAS